MNKPTFDAMLAQYEVKEASGAGEVSWENGVHCEIPEVVISGKAEQTWYEGRNLFDISKIKTQGENANTWISEVGENYIVISEAETHTGNGYCNSGMSLLELVPSLEVGNTYTLSLATNSKIDGIYTPLLAVWHNGETRTITEDNLTEKVVFYGLNVSGGQAPGPNKISNIQIEKGTVATSYEPYTGGIPAPNLEYPIMPTFSEGTKVVSRGRNLADAFIASDQYRAKTEKIASNTFRVTRDSPTTHGGYGQIKIEGLPKNRSVCIVCSVRDRGEPIDDKTFARLFPWKEPNAGDYYASILHLGENGENTKRSEPFIATTGYLYCGMYPNLANDGDSAIYEIAVYLADDDTEVCDPVYFDGGEADVPELLAIPNTNQMDFWNPQTGYGERNLIEIVPTSDLVWRKNAAYKDYESFFLPKSLFTEDTPNEHCLCNYFQGNTWNYVANREGNYAWAATSSFGIRIHKSFLGEDYDSLPSDEDKCERFKQVMEELKDPNIPLKFWLVRKTPEIIQATPQPLIQPKGACEIIQTEGTISGCPISAKYLAHK